MKRGLSILEVALGIALFSIIGTMLFQSMMQVTRTLRTITDVSSLDMRIAVVNNLLEKDLSGATLFPMIPIKDEKEEETKPPAKTDKKKKAPEKNKKEDKEIYPKKGFYFEAEQDGNLKLFTFVSTNPVAVYETAKPVPVRIVYTLAPSQEVPGTFVLNRQEGPNYMDLQVFIDVKSPEVRKVEVVSGVQKIACEFYGIEVKKEENEKTDVATSKPEKNKTVVTTKETKEEKTEKKWVDMDYWNSDEKEEDKPRALPLVPELVKITLTLKVSEKESRMVELWYSTTGAIAEILLEGIKPVPEGPSKKPGEGKLDGLFDKDKISSSLHEKLQGLEGPKPPKDRRPPLRPGGRR